MENNKLNPQQRGYRRALAAIIITGASAFSMEYCLQPVISHIAATFMLNPAQASLAVSAAMLGMALTLLILTAFAGRLPRRKMLAGSLVVSSAVLLGVGFTHSFAAVVALRFVQGCILALVPVLAMAYVNEEFIAGKIRFGIGLYVSGTTLGGLSGRILASVLTDYIGWQHAIMSLSLLAALSGIAVWLLLPKERNFAPQAAKGLAHHLFSRANQKLFYLCAAAFFMMGAFVAVYNFIPYVLKDAPYNLSQSVIGFLFAVQLCGTFSSSLTAKLSAQHSSSKIISICLAFLAGGALLTVHHLLVIKIFGLALLTAGLFGAHAAASGWCGQLSADKAAAGSLYMFSYYSGASVLGSLGGLFYSNLGWPGVVAMAVLAAAAALAAVHFIATAPMAKYAVCKEQ